jgi:hypothetical protein
MAIINISQIRMKRGNTAASSNYVGPLGELLVDTGLQTIRIQDGVTPGGWLMSNTGGGGGGTNYSNSNVKSYLTSGVFDGNLIPSGNNIYSIGSLTNQWKSLYVSTGTIYINGIPLSLDANNSVTVDGNPISSTINYADIPGAVTDISQLTDENDLLIGTQGPQGPQGDQGIQGVQGIQGIQGNVGPRGEQGLQGVQGNVGPQGPQGIQGIQGNTGPQGERGIQGNVGPQGIQGNTGPTGAQGIQGNIGATGPQGIQGIKGDRGDQGISVTLVGNVALPENLNFSGNAGEAYIVTSSGNLFFWNTTVTNWVDIGPIVGPRGDKGDRGEQGIQGNVGLQGDTGPTGAQGEPGPQGIQGDTGPEGPQGDTGPEGPQGAQGIQGNIGPQGPQGIQGNIGPQGATGATGAQGVQGEAGIGVPAGGTAGQVLAKVDGDDYHTEWVDQTGGGGNVTVAPVTVGNTAEGTEGALWYNTEDGRTYVYALDTWIDANPPVVPGNMVGYGQDGNITLNEDARINYANGVSIMNSVYGDAEVASFLDAYTGNIAKIGSAPLNITAADIRLSSDNETWRFASTGNIIFPDGTEQATAYTGGGGGGSNYGNTQVSAFLNDYEGNIYINSEGSGLIVDAAGDKRVGFMKYFGIEASFVHANGATKSIPFQIGRVAADDITQANNSVFTSEVYIAANGKVGINTTGPTEQLSVNGNVGISGALLIGDNTTISNDGEFRIWADNDITVYRNGQDGYGVKAGNVETYTNNTLRTVVNSSNVEIKTGNLVIPNNGGILYANGTNILNSIPSIGNITFDGSEIITSDSSITLQVPSGIPTGVANWNGQGGWNQGFYGNVATTGGTGSGLTVDVAAGGGGYINIEAISINNPGTGYTNGDVITIDNENNLPGTFTVVVIPKNWTFGANGALITPGSVRMTPGGRFINDGSTGATASHWVNYPDTTNNWFARFYSDEGANLKARLGLENLSDITIETTSDVDGLGNAGPDHKWKFNGDGSTTFPDHGAVTITGDLTVSNLIVNGNTTTINTESYTVVDNIIQMATANPADTLDLGFVAHRTVNSTLEHTGLVRDASIGKWSLFSNVVPQPGSTIDLTNAILDDLLVGTVQGTDFKFANGVSILSTVTVPETYSNTNVTAYLSGNITTGNILPAANVTYNLGSPTQQWNSLYVSSETIYLGGVPLSVSDGALLVGNSPITANTGTVSFSYNRIKGNPANATGTIFTKNTDRQNLYGSGSGTTTGISFDEIGEISSVAAGWIMTWADGRTVEITNVVDWGSFRSFQFEQQSFGAGEVFPMTIQSPDYFAGSDSIVQITPNANVTSSTWTFYGNGNVRFPDGSTQTTAYTGGGSTYSNANVASYLPTYSGNIGAGNIVTTGATSGNISGANYISANAFQVSTGIFWANGTAWSSSGGGTTYSNANVASYLTAGNISVGTAGFTVLPNIVAQFTTNVNSYGQVNMQNINAGADATTEIVATANNGTDTIFFIDMGIAGNTYDNSSPSNSLGTIIYANDAYLYAQGNTSANIGGNLAIGTSTAGRSVTIFAGGINRSSNVATFANTGVTVYGNITAANIVTTGTYGNITGANVISANTFIASGVNLRSRKTILLNRVQASATSVTGNANVTAWSSTYTSSGGAVEVTAQFTAFATGSGLLYFHLQRDGVIVDTAPFFFNNTNVHMVVPTLTYISTAETGSHTYSVRIGSSVTVDTGDYCHMVITEF